METAGNFGVLKEEINDLREGFGELKIRADASELRIAENEDREIGMTKVLLHSLRMQKQLENKCEELEGRERRNNLRMYSVPEKCEENCMMDFVENLMREKLDVSGDIPIERAHRATAHLTGHSDRPRSIIVRFQNYNVRQRVLQAAWAKKDIRAFWREKGFSGEILAGSSTECPFCVTFDATSPSGNAVLVGFIAGQQASQWSSKESERREAVLSSLIKYLGPEARSFIHYEEKDWAKEDYSGGCPVNVMAPGLLTYYHPSLRKPCGRIHWAGTETATLWCGYMSGAVQAGQRAALEVLAELFPTSLTREEQDAVQNKPSDEGAAKQTPTSKLRYLCTSKAVVIATLAVSAAVLLARNQNAVLNTKAYVTNAFTTTRHKICVL
ncbi:hypothetical protein KUCAC02_009344 [Chaenocephalus aceratus]|uniref:Uncharacterized protein n=1 Tax=Chaenocephalus aceratus TaxID=36190 RepID=A0ACB9WUR2_CHAAC|nr:hypothetical protein KUCAC02_009344 [Chaenocephalus aceratus]